VQDAGCEEAGELARELGSQTRDIGDACVGVIVKSTEQGEHQPPARHVPLRYILNVPRGERDTPVFSL